ncbi:MAG: DUF512 domain-containing protein, partial [Oscillospiraceae bacterium]|nr:DUF512 domain-containing protein [Oscillospiraceae bacterium]
MPRTVISEVAPGSPARRAGVRAGETLLEINGHAVEDVLDYQYYGYDRAVTLKLKTPAGRERRVRLKKEEGQDLGLRFEDYLMDRMRTCANRCLFCFVDQLPEGLRPTLYCKDDDARLSFLTGSYITLTNLTEREMQRIKELKISPIHVSVHATDPELRSFLMGNEKAGQVLARLQDLAGAGIFMDCQIVACPGINDGAALKKTMEDLKELYPQVESVSVVPVGLTRHRQGLFSLKPYDADSASAVLDMVEDFAEKCLKDTGSRIFWCSDEFYLRAGRNIPEDEFYEDYFQLENGVGMLRLLKTEFDERLEEMEPPAGPLKNFSVACGTDAAGWIDDLLEEAAKKGAARGTVYAVPNRFLGDTITVSGLLTGRDLIERLRGGDLGERLLLPENMLRHEGDVFLDDVSAADVARELGVPVEIVGRDGAALC